MQDDSITSVSQLSDLIKVAESLGVEAVKRQNSKSEIYSWMNDILIRLKYRTLRKKDKGIVRKYLGLYSGYTASHIDHLISQYADKGKVTAKERTQPEFPRIYTDSDIELLAEVSQNYDHQNGKALKEVCGEMYTLHKDIRFERLSRISVSHIYALKKTNRFRENVLFYTKTKPAAVNIGERKKPYPEGKPGFLRVDSVHQGDKDKEKGVYHINLVDEVTQWQIKVCVEGISEHFLVPALEEALEAFPFTILNFHSDNGSEYINKVVAALLEKLRIHQTKSRSRHTNDNALAESKNGATVRTHTGYAHIPRKYAPLVNDYYKKYRNPFLNFNRFCAFPDEEIDEKGKIVKKYRTYLTPCQKLLSIRGVEAFLKEGLTVSSLEKERENRNHFTVAKEMQKEKAKLFKSFSSQNML